MTSCWPFVGETVHVESANWTQPNQKLEVAWFEQKSVLVGTLGCHYINIVHTRVWFQKTELLIPGHGAGRMADHKTEMGSTAEVDTH